MGRNFDIDIEISRLASRQHGNVTRSQLIALGLHDPAIAYRVRLGRLHRVHRSVYAVGRPARMPLERAAAAVLACGRHAALSHQSALVLWGIWKVWPDEPMHVSVTSGDRRPKGITVHRPAGLHRRDVRPMLGIRATSPARTMLDVAADLTDKQLARAINTARLARILTPGQLADVVARNELHPATARLEPFTDATKAPTRSDWERDFPDFCAHYGLPEPVLNTTLHGYEIDVLFAEERLIVELDGWDSHQTREAFELDRERDAHALEYGLATVRVTKDRVEETPDREAARLQRILESRRAA